MTQFIFSPRNKVRFAMIKNLETKMENITFQNPRSRMEVFLEWLSEIPERFLSGIAEYDLSKIT